MKSGNKMRKLWRKYWRAAVLIILAVGFAVGTAAFNFRTQDRDFVKWASPDETANYVFAKLYGQEDKLTIFEKYNLYTDNIMHPRSFRSDAGYLKPVSFLGIILIYGKIASVFGYRVIPYLTPVFAGLGLIIYYLLIKKIFGRKNAFISVFLLAALPPFVYYSARSMFHNVLFLVLFMGGLYCALLMSGEKDRRRKFSFKLKWSEFDWRGLSCAAAGGGLTGMAIITRASELIWIGPLFLFLWIAYFRRVDLAKIFVFLSFLFLSVLPALYWNQVLYGSYFFGGYNEMNKTITELAGAGRDIVTTTVKGQFSFYGDLFAIIKNNIFYFGLHPRQSSGMFYHYFILMFPWLFWSALLGLVILLRRGRRLKKKYAVYLSGYFLTALILVLYYGSWNFHDNPDAGSFTIGNSYTRYWLPVYLGAIPLASYFFSKLSRALTDLLRRAKARLNCGRKFLRNAILTVIVGAVFSVSTPFVLGNSEESLLPLARRQTDANRELEKILGMTESNAAIITLYHDKLLFPERKVIVGLFDDTAMVARYAKLAGLLPVYYYNFTFSPADLDYLNNRRLAEAGLRIKKIEKITPDFTLYRLYKQ